MTRTERRVVVLGGGVIGLSCAWFLTRIRGVQVTLLEREPRHDRHSSGRSAEIQRVAVPDPVTRRLAVRSAELLAEPALAGLSPPAPFGQGEGLIICADDPSPEWAVDLPEGVIRPLARDAFEARAPHFLSEAPHLFELPGAGRIHAGRLMQCLARAAQAAGATLLRSRGDARIEVAGDAVTGAWTPCSGALPADDVVIAAGAWSRGLGAAVGADVPLRPTRRHLFAFPRRAAEPPQTPIVWDDTTGFYARPEGDLWHTSISDVEPVDWRDVGGSYPVDNAMRDRAMASYARQMREAEGRAPAPARAWSGYRDLSPDDRPILGPDGRVAGLHWCAGAGGHGVTLSLGVGEALASCFTAEPRPTALESARGRFGATE